MHCPIDLGGGGGEVNLARPYAGLSPDLIEDAVASVGFEPDGHLLALNSFENRVYQVGVEPDAALPGRFLVGKFYRPGRWSDAAIAEEHAFTAELVAAELPVVAPLAHHGRSLHQHGGFRFALFPRQGGRAPELEQVPVAEWLGRLLARLHNVGAERAFSERQTIDTETLVWRPHLAALASGLLPNALEDRYDALVSTAADAIDDAFARVDPVLLRLHGDCHPGNVLWTDAGPHFVDLDDSRRGPAIQDLWMLMSGDVAQREAMLAAYRTFRPLDPRELDLIAPLRLLRQIHYAGWIAERWGDPAFPAAFAHVASPAWWEGHLRDIAAALETF